MSERTLVFVGSLTRNTPYFAPAAGAGIHVFALEEKTGTLQRLSVTKGIENPTYIAFDPGANLLYATSEVFEWNQGLVTSYALNPQSMSLTYISSQPTLGHLSAFISLDKRRRHLLVANYIMREAGALPDKALTVFPVDAGIIGAASSSVMRFGSGPNPERQERSHAHCLVETPDGLLAAADLGTDEVAFYGYHPNAGRLSDKPVEVVVMPPGSGPRHLICAEDDARIFVLNELAQTVAVLARARADTPYEIVQIVAAVEGPKSGGISAGIVLSPCGRFLFASNRGDDSIMAFRTDGSDGKLTKIGACASGGQTPRSFAVDPSGRFLVVANQDGHNLTILRIDQASGELTDNLTGMEIKSPMCVSISRLS